METEISKSRFKAKALQYFRHVERTGESMIITDRGQPTLVIQKYTRVEPSPLERLEGSVTRYDDPFAPVDDESWDALA